MEENRCPKGLGVRLAILQFLFGVIHKKVGHSKSAKGIEQRA